MTSVATETSAQELASDLCVLGAGIAGLNALFAASRYLSRDQKVVLVDRRPSAGGMWSSVYDYVRLHQPHPMFTAGDTPWTTGNDPSHLATRSEVLAHLRHCLDVLKQRVTLDERFGYEYRSHDEAGAGPDEVLVLCEPTSAGAPPLRIKAKKLVKAFGYDIQTKDALPISSRQVRSLSPDKDDLLGAEMAESRAPIYIAGGGKTAMDTAHTLITRFPDKQVSLLIGKGTMFTSRDKLFPSGLKRWFGGSTPLATFLDVAHRFDGRNEDEALAYFRSTYAISLAPDARRFMFGTLSEDENAVIAAGAHEIIKDYLSDVVDRDGQPTLLMRSGESRAIEPGSVIVNCTGYVTKEPGPYEPYVSRSGKVISVQSSSAIHVLSSCAAYLLVHLSYLDQLNRLPLYELDLPRLSKASREVGAIGIIPHMLYNMGLILNAVPRSVLAEFGTDVGRWFPAPRRLLAGIQFVRYQKENPDHLRRSLDTIRERFDVRLGPLTHALDA